MLGGEFNPARARFNYKNLATDQFRQFQRDVSLEKSMEKTVLGAYQNSESLERLISPLTNMERFLWSIVPSVPAHFISKTTMCDWRTCNVEYQPYFVLGDFWESFKEWSAYGVGVPFMLDDNDYVVQYYVPYLSAIQIYVDPSKLSPNWRKGSQENDDGCFVKDTIDLSPKIESFSWKDQQNGVKEHLSKDDSETVTSKGYLLFEYLEHDTPFIREPLFTKMSELALASPELKNLRSCDILSSSWVSVAWYPICRIPTGPVMKDLEACFLTYHSLCTPSGDVNGRQEVVVTYPNDFPTIPVPSFALSTYKYRESMWTSGSSSGQTLVNTLSDAAYNWLNMLQVQSPDFNFFASRR